MAKLVYVEGSAAEIVEVSRGLGIAAPGNVEAISLPAGPSPETVSSAATAGKRFCSSEVAHRVLTRIGLSKEQRTVLKVLSDAGDAWTLASKLQTATGYSPGQFAGLMGAFGRRLTHTKGYVGGSGFFDQEWDHDHGCYRYRLPPSVREAVAKADLA